MQHNCKAMTKSGEPCSRPATDDGYCGQHKRKRDKDKGRKLLVTIRERAKIMFEADEENRSLAMDDLKFVNVPGAQWDENMRKERGNRPCYEFNKLRINGKRVINEMRSSRPQGKVRAVENGDKDIAELYEGLCRNIWNMSDGDSVVDHAAEYQVDAGMAGWRVVTDYSDDSSFDQDIKVEPIKNPFCLYADPACQDMMKRDAEDWLLIDRISKRAFKAEYPDADPVHFEEDGIEFDDDDEWEDDDFVRIVEYWYKEPHEKEIWQLEDGKTVDSESDEAEGIAPELIKRRRMVRTHKIMMCIASGNAILKGPVEWAGHEFPFVMIYGEYKIVDGRPMWWGLHRFAKDAQRSYNVSRTSIDETIAQAPKSYFFATKEQAKGNLAHWEEAIRKNFPVMVYNSDPAAPGGPQRIGGADVPVALLNQAQVSAQDIRDTVGLHEASFGEESNEKSGIALARKQAQGQMVTFNFPDNMAKGIKRTWEILVDLIPNIYDAERELRVLGEDGAEDYARVNQLVQDDMGNWVRVNDLSVGKYDTAVSTGPSYSTLRQEAADIYGQAMQGSPELMPLIGDLFFKSLDYPYADEVAERLQTLLPPEIKQKMTEGKDIPPEAQMVLDQAQQMMQQVEQHGQLVQQAEQELQQEQAASEKTKAEIKAAIADLRREEAEFKAVVAESKAQLTEQKAALEVKRADLERRSVEVGDVQSAQQSIDEIQQTIGMLDDVIAQYVVSASQAMAALNQEVSKPRPKFKSGAVRREGDQLLADIELDDGTVQTLSAVRENGQLRAVPVQSDGA